MLQVRHVWDLLGVSDSVKVLIKLVNVVCHKSKTITERSSSNSSNVCRVHNSPQSCHWLCMVCGCQNEREVGRIWGMY